MRGWDVPGPIALVLRLGLFTGVLAVAYVLVLAAIANVHIRGQLPISNLPQHRSCLSATALTLREVRGESRVVDLLFLGSSHAYRGFDPRVFDTEGLRSFNLGTSAQTPLNMYYLLREYLPRLDVRRAAIIEVYPELLQRGGAEASVDRLLSGPLSGSVLRMVLATHSIRAFNALMMRVLDRRTPGPDAMPVCLDRNDTYVGRGYVETRRGARARPLQVNDHTIRVRQEQLVYLRKAVNLLREQGTRVVLVVQPLPADAVAAARNYDAVSDRLRRLADETGSFYVDFNRPPHREVGLTFYDSNHLTQPSVEQFDRRFYSYLLRKGIAGVHRQGGALVGSDLPRR